MTSMTSAVDADSADSGGAGTASAEAARSNAVQIVQLAQSVWVRVGMYAVAVLAACYTGFRLPNLWAVTLQEVSLQDGFHRRVLVGTVLQPLAAVFGYNYWFYATVSFLALAALLTILAVAFVRAPLSGRSALILIWLLLPTGGFWFNEAGYLDQFLYLFLLAALWLRHRGRPIGASAVMAFAPFVHELAALTVLPIFALVVVVSEDRIWRAVRLLAPAAATALLVLALPPASNTAPQRATARLQHANFVPRSDVYSLYQRTLAQSWRLYSIHEVLIFVAPIAALLAAGFWLLHRMDGPTPGDTWYAQALAVAAIGAPALLAFAGWDAERWGYLTTTNFLVVAWVWWGRANRRTRGDWSPAQWVLLTLVVLIMTRTEFSYFDGQAPRIIGWHPFVAFVDSIRDGSLFRIPQV